MGEGSFTIRDLAREKFDFDALMLSPGIPHHLPAPHPVAARACAADIPILCDAELLFQAVRRAGSRARFVGITGTNGKSTTTALLAHMLGSAGRPVAAGGNLGPAALALPLLGDDGVYVLEMSSFMLEQLATLRFDAAAMLNLSADHLDRHGDMKGYGRAKRAIFDRQTADDLAVVGIDDAPSREIAAWLRTQPAQLTTVSSGTIPSPPRISASPADIHCDSGTLRDTTGTILTMAEASALPGAHNAQNAAAAAALGSALGLTRREIANGIRSFPGLPHRQQHIATIDGIGFINDSKATNADAAACALGCYDRVVWIAGGQAKAGGISSLAPYLPAHRRRVADRPRCAGACRHSCRVRRAARDRRLAGCRGAGSVGRSARSRSTGCAVVPGLRQLRSVQRFRRPRRPLRRAGVRAAPRGGRLMALSRADTSMLGRWWWTVDRWTLGAIGMLIGFGYIMVLAASPSVAERIGDARNALIFKQVLFLALAGGLVVAVSLLSPRDIRRLALAGCIMALLLTAATILVGVEIKGARRWIALPGLSIQPSEFLKPCFAVVAAWLIAEGRRAHFPGSLIAGAIYVVIVLLLKAQPDVGMTAVITAVFFAQLYVNGLKMYLVGIGVAAICAGAMGAYLLFPHVQVRMHEFLHPTGANTYQVTTALEAFGNGGLFGRGPGEGRVKDVLPDAHADFVFAVAGEEFGMVLCLVILGVFAFVVVRGLLRLLKDPELFSVLACTGLLVGFGLQAFVNMASSLELIPTKGMTLPFVSYGGSSVLAVAMGMGMLLALTRRRHHGDVP